MRRPRATLNRMVTFIIGTSFRNTGLRRLQLPRIASEALSLLRWRSRQVRCSVIVAFDPSLRPGEGRAIHQWGRHRIVLNPTRRGNGSSSTIRHELLHVLLKSRIRGQLVIAHQPFLRISKNYRSQTLRENLEEYVVRTLNALHLRRQRGHRWYRRQVAHEVLGGMREMPSIARIVERWSKSRSPFSRSTFLDIAESLESRPHRNGRTSRIKATRSSVISQKLSVTSVPKRP